MKPLICCQSTLSFLRLGVLLPVHRLCPPELSLVTWRWPSQSILTFSIENTPDLTNDTAEEIRNAIRSAFDVWEQELSKVGIHFQEVLSEEADIQLLWTWADIDAVADASYRWLQGNYWRIRFSQDLPQCCSADKWSASLDPDDWEGSTAYVKATALHEIGHAIGLGHITRKQGQSPLAGSAIMQDQTVAFTSMQSLGVLDIINIGRHYNIPITFPDPNLEAVVREAINKLSGPIYSSDLETLTSLSAVHKNITDLTGLEYCTNLNDLDLSVNPISDITPLESLTNLNDLDLSVNPISDISPLESLTNLEFLDLYGNQISSISPLESLTNLVSLGLDYNQISNISPLESLTNLERLYLSYNQISNISPLESLTNLTRLNLQGNEIIDISPLESLTNLNYLFLWDNQISDILPLVTNTGISSRDWVDLRFNPLSTSSVTTYIPILEGRGVTVKY